jgi:hypothetical protein
LVTDAELDARWRATFGRLFVDDGKTYTPATKADKRKWLKDNRRYLVKIG